MVTTEQPSRIRHLVVFSATLMAVLLYLDRYCVALTVDYVREDLRLTQTQMSWFLSAFFWSYALAQVPSGWLSDRYGARIMLVIYILSWSFFTAMIGAAHSLALLLLARLGCGLGQAGAYPTSAGMVSKWVPFSNRGTASAIISVGGRLGGAIAQVLTAFLMVLFVPLETSSLLKESELLEPAQLAAKLAPIPENSPAARKVWDALPPEAQALTQRAKAGRELSEPERQILLKGLNHVIQSDGFFDEDAFRSVNLVREALKLLARQREGESLSEDQQQRLNRFLLEGTFPKEVGKIYVNGWRPVMMVYGVAGIFVAVFFWVCVRNRPEGHPSCNEAECRLIETGRPPGAPSPHGKAGMVPWKRLLTSGSMWLMCVQQFTTGVGWLFLVTWLPRYLIEVHQVPILERGMMASVPLTVGIVGMFAGGRLTDWLAGLLGVRWGRRWPLFFTRFMAAAGYFWILWLSSLPEGHVLNTPWVFIAGFSLVAFSTDLGTAGSWAFMQDVGGRYVGSILGWGNMWGNLGAAVSPLIYDRFLGESPTIDNWNNMFLVCALSFVLSGLCGLGVDASKPIAPPDEEAD